MKIKYLWEKSDLAIGTAFKMKDRDYIIVCAPNIEEFVLLDVSINNTSRISVSVLLERMNQFDSGNGAIPCEVKLARLPV